MTYEELREVADNIRYKDWYLNLVPLGNRTHMRWQWQAPCVLTKRPAWQESRTWDVSLCDEEGFIRTALLAAKTAEEHECYEHFNYKGVRVFDPHRSIL